MLLSVLCQRAPDLAATLVAVRRHPGQPARLTGGVLPPGDERLVESYALPLDLGPLAFSGGGEEARAWEIEIGFGKGRFLLDRAAREPNTGFLGIEIVSKYFRLAASRAAHRDLHNLLLLRGEALYLLSVCLPRGFARAMHVYFPDPWPKARHHKRRLFDPETVDLLLGTLAPGGRLFFATDFLEYGSEVHSILDSHPEVVVEALEVWPEGPRTNYEAKYVAEGRPIQRLVVQFRDGHGPSDPDRLVHPGGVVGISVGPSPGGDRGRESGENSTQTASAEASSERSSGSQ